MTLKVIEDIAVEYPKQFHVLTAARCFAPEAVLTKNPETMDPRLLQYDHGPTAAHRNDALVVATVMRQRGDTGVQTHTNTFLDYLAMQGPRPPCITPFACGKVAVCPVFAMRSLLGLLHRRESTVRWYRYWHYAFLKRALRRVVADGRPMVIYAQDPLAARAALEARVSRDQRVAMAAHFNVSQAEEWAEKGMLKRGGRYYESIRRCEQTVLPRLDGIVFVSEFMKEVLIRAVPDVGRIPSIVVPNFVTVPPLKPRQPVRDLISIGSLEPRKNQQYLIRVLAAAKDMGRRPSLTIVGDGADRHCLQTLSKELGVAEQIAFVGSRTEAADMICDHRVYCHASRMESFGITLIEAMARGVPVIAAPVGGVREVFDAGTEGLHWDLNDPQGGARDVLRLLDDTALRKQISEAALRRFHCCFRTDVVAVRLHQFLLSLIAEPSVITSECGAFA